ncbi:endolytic transglycosylase MltG [Bradymonas sediminis]|uniref:Endolytic murein transglycosylase n=1 Tax=Bradymonas sediminis TaxID=1548548 RepID=A0A2Z4FJF7_9DELT|nr:endolytic transglycosylase MltG [Bradymonas sediminis]AWV89147.1 endolytic transglycosylase MltG [Bradymonas sediminis]TDP64387.1 UPF0755 protein [Bradymonas sediminis]
MAKSKKNKLNPRLAQPAGRDRAMIALRVCAVILGLVIIVLGAVYAHYQSYIQKPVLAEGATKTLVIPPDSAWPRVVQILEAEHLIRRPTYFEFWARRRQLPAQVKAGSYELSGPIGLDELADALREGGRFDETTVTFPEGLTIFHLADRVDRLGLVDRASFLRAARDEVALARAGIDGESFEGYLFPDTYRFRKGTPAEEIIDRLHQRWVVMWEALSAEHAESMAALTEQYEFDRRDFITLASLIQRETNLASESDVIARVFLNRIDRGMRLQTDPTCVYGEKTYKEIPRPKYCKDPMNRYSTYVISGLPPGPIANPGKVSIAAALNPSHDEEAKKYLFFVARRDGSRGHHFTKTFAAHKRAIRRYLR